MQKTNMPKKEETLPFMTEVLHRPARISVINVASWDTRAKGSNPAPINSLIFSTVLTVSDAKAESRRLKSSWSGINPI